jgi:uncharacterized lipoprotein NlpE involved in copper resistance
MGLKEEFISYCEWQRTADELLRSQSPSSNSVIQAFKKANTMKKSIMDKLEAIDEARNY